MKTTFNRNPLVYGKTMEQPSANDLKNTFGLWNASWDDAVRYGGEVTRAALQTIQLHGDRKNVIVDTKIHMLLAGMSPAIPGWHNDGSPRDAKRNPQGNEAPDILSQENDPTFNRYHILVTGKFCLTQFISRPIELDIPEKPDASVYAMISETVNSMVKDDASLAVAIPSCTAIEFDWWDIHTGVIASGNEWRFLIRVCESDYYEPRKDLREVIRIQSQVYSPTNFGW